MITHHPAEETIAAYAAGSLDEASALALATHLTLCPACRRLYQGFEDLGGALVAEMPAEPLHADALAATLARARTGGNIALTPQPASLRARSSPGTSPLFPMPLQFYVGGDQEAAKWKTLGPGIQHMPLIADGSSTARLLRIAPGKSVFQHSHEGNEMTIVLRGSYQAAGATFRRGDLEMADGDVSHRPVAGMDDVCICLAVTDAPLRFDNWIGRLMQPFIGI